MFPYLTSSYAGFANNFFGWLSSKRHIWIFFCISVCFKNSLRMGPVSGIMLIQKKGQRGSLYHDKPRLYHSKPFLSHNKPRLNHNKPRLYHNKHYPGNDYSYIEIVVVTKKCSIRWKSKRQWKLLTLSIIYQVGFFYFIVMLFIIFLYTNEFIILWIKKLIHVILETKRTAFCDSVLLHLLWKKLFCFACWHFIYEIRWWEVYNIF